MFSGIVGLFQLIASLFFGQALFLGVDGGPSLIQQGIDFVVGLLGIGGA